MATYRTWKRCLVQQHSAGGTCNPTPFSGGFSLVILSAPGLIDSFRLMNHAHMSVDSNRNSQVRSGVNGPEREGRAELTPLFCFRLCRSPPSWLWTCWSPVSPTSCCGTPTTPSTNRASVLTHRRTLNAQRLPSHTHSQIRTNSKHYKLKCLGALFRHNKEKVCDIYTKRWPHTQMFL